jgi:hypothetical protein
MNNRANCSSAGIDTSCLTCGSAQLLSCSSLLAVLQRWWPERTSGVPATRIPSPVGWTALKRTDSLDCSSTQGEDASPPFPPLSHTQDEAKEALAHLLRRDPRQLGVERARWDLSSLLAQLTTFHLKGPSSLWHVLDRLGIRWLRGRTHVHRPDPL